MASERLTHEPAGSPSLPGETTLTEELIVRGVHSDVSIRRDPWGVPHIVAEVADDAWFGLGYACASDRLWHMEWDRRRATGRCAEVVGQTAVVADTLARRLRLDEAARSDVAAMSDPTRSSFDAYAAGVNARAGTGPLPPEFGEMGLTPEPWQPWHSVAAFKIRHVLMGTWEVKLAQARLLAMIGPQAYARLDELPGEELASILQSQAGVADLVTDASIEIAAAAADLGFLRALDGGSNSWAIHGERSVHGSAIVCNDSHRFLDVPNVYWQARLTCPEFDVAGATFPGLPGFPHFGHNRRVAWSITHAMADYQDLYVEQFDVEVPGRYRVPGGWATAEHHTSRIRVRDGADVDVEIWSTRHGPVVHGDPRTGPAVALRYTAIDGPCRTFEVLRPMLAASSVNELLDSQRDWVDPVNNLVCGDDAGNIGYLTRGVLPIRSSRQHRRFPAPGWSGAHEWIGTVPFEDLPRTINPPEGFIVTANQPIETISDIYIAHAFATPYRAERIVELLSHAGPLDCSRAASIQTDVTSTAARRWVRFLLAQDPLEGDAETARVLLGNWDGALEANSPAALLYGCFRRNISRELFEPVVGGEAWDWLIRGALPAQQQMIGRWLGRIVAGLDAGIVPPDGSGWRTVLQQALTSAWETATRMGGNDPRRWRWAGVHRAIPRHPLSVVAAVGERYDPPRLPLGGDGDTVWCAEYPLGDDGPFDVMYLPVYRQVVDLADAASASWVVPGGASGVPGSAHYVDQLALWARGERIPMYPELAHADSA